MKEGGLCATLFPFSVGMLDSQVVAGGNYFSRVSKKRPTRAAL